MKIIDAQVHIWSQTVAPTSGPHRIFDAFGPKRFFRGTDLARMQRSYRQCVTFFTEELPWLRGNDLEDVMGHGLCDWIGWTTSFRNNIRAAKRFAI